MKIITKDSYARIRTWVYRNARPVSLALWRCCLEDAPLDELLTALTLYQNPDGGFGHALEADSWNPASAPIQAERALQLLDMPGKPIPTDNAVVQGLLRYLAGEDGRATRGWCFRVPGNNDHPHAPWWTYSDENRDSEENLGLTALMCKAILELGKDRPELMARMEEDMAFLLAEANGDEFGDMGLAGYLLLAESAPERLAGCLPRMLERANASIVRDPQQWASYGVRPSNYITSPEHPLYAGNEEIVEAELDYLVDSLPQDDVWPITWLWYGSMDVYGPAFYVSENWWKAEKAVEKLLFLRAFGRLEQ